MASFRMAPTDAYFLDDDEDLMPATRVTTPDATAYLWYRYLATVYEEHQEASDDQRRPWAFQVGDLVIVTNEYIPEHGKLARIVRVTPHPERPAGWWKFDVEARLVESGEPVEVTVPSDLMRLPVGQLRRMAKNGDL